MTEPLKALLGVSPTSSTLEREFSARTIILSLPRKHLYCPTLLKILQYRNFLQLGQIRDADQAKINV